MDEGLIVCDETNKEHRTGKVDEEGKKEKKAAKGVEEKERGGGRKRDTGSRT